MFICDKCKKKPKFRGTVINLIEFTDLSSKGQEEQEFIKIYLGRAPPVSDPIKLLRIQQICPLNQVMVGFSLQTCPMRG